MGDSFAFHLHGRGDSHRDGGQDQSNTYPLQVGDPGRISGDSTEGRDEYSVIHGDDHDEECEGDDGEGGRRDLERRSEPGVHRDALLDRECLKLG